MSASRDAQNLTKIRRAIKASPTRATLHTIVRDTSLNIGVVQRLVRKHHLNVAWRARETIEAESFRYCEAIEKFQAFCADKGINFRRGMVAALRAFAVKNS